jgi:hypothetical protein
MYIQTRFLQRIRVFARAVLTSPTHKQHSPRVEEISKCFSCVNGNKAVLLDLILELFCTPQILYVNIHEIYDRKHSLKTVVEHRHCMPHK